RSAGAGRGFHCAGWRSVGRGANFAENGNAFRRSEVNVEFCEYVAAGDVKAGDAAILLRRPEGSVVRIERQASEGAARPAICLDLLAGGVETDDLICIGNQDFSIGTNAKIVGSWAGKGGGEVRKLCIRADIKALHAG